MKVVKSDLITLAKAGKFDVIIHGCNCMCEMGAGIAKSIKSEFPEAFSADLKTGKADRNKLGKITFALFHFEGHELTVVNGYTQFDFRGKGVLVDYDAVRSVFQLVKKHFSGKRIAYPKIGAGMARGDWNKIADIIEEELSGEDHTLVEYIS